MCYLPVPLGPNRSQFLRAVMLPTTEKMDDYRALYSVHRRAREITVHQVGHRSKVYWVRQSDEPEKARRTQGIGFVGKPTGTSICNSVSTGAQNLALR